MLVRVRLFLAYGFHRQEERSQRLDQVVGYGAWIADQLELLVRALSHWRSPAASRPTRSLWNPTDFGRERQLPATPVAPEDAIAWNDRMRSVEDLTGPMNGRPIDAAR
jgi:hypothetical protein